MLLATKVYLIGGKGIEVSPLQFKHLEIASEKRRLKRISQRDQRKTRRRLSYKPREESILRRTR